MAAPTLTDYQQSNWADTSNATEATPTVTWAAGDLIVVLGATEDNATTTLTLPTATGLTFSQIAATNTANNTKCYVWTATAAGSGSSAISSTIAGGEGAPQSRAMSAFVFSGSDGIGTPANITGSAAKVISLTRVQANSAVVLVMADWNAVNDTTVTADPAGGTQRVAQFVTGRATFFVFSWGDQGATGTTSYGIGSHTGTVKMTGYAVEVKGTTGGATKAPPPRRRPLRVWNRRAA